MATNKIILHILLGFLLITILGYIYLPNLVQHATLASDLYRFNDDVQQQIWPFYFYSDRNVFQDDPIAAYYLACFPQGFKFLYRGWTALADPILLSTYLPYLLYFFTGLALALSAYRVGGVGAVWVALVFFLGSGIFLDRMTGGLPRAFAYPIFSWLIYAVVSGRMFLLASLAVVGAAFYPPAGALAGLTLAFVLLIPKVLPKSWAHVSLSRRIVWILLFGIVSVAVMAPTMYLSSQYGSKISMTDSETYPELGPKGRYVTGDRPPWSSLKDAGKKANYQALSGVGKPWSATARAIMEEYTYYPHAIKWLGVFALLALASCSIFFRYARRLLVYLTLLIAIYEVSKPVAPHLYLPERYLAYGFPPLIIFLVSDLFSKATQAVFRVEQNSVLHSLLILFLSFPVLLPLASHSRYVNGLKIHIEEPERELVEYLAKLPANTHIAGFPNGVIEAVPYLSKRKVFMSNETYQVFHTEYVSLLRERMYALVKAYYSGRRADVIALRDTYGVTHLVRKRSDFMDKPRQLFQPYRNEVNRQIKLRKQHGDELQQLAERASYF